MPFVAAQRAPSRDAEKNKQKVEFVATQIKCPLHDQSCCCVIESRHGPASARIRTLRVDTCMPRSGEMGDHLEDKRRESRDLGPWT